MTRNLVRCVGLILVLASVTSGSLFRHLDKWGHFKTFASVPDTEAAPFIDWLSRHLMYYRDPSLACALGDFIEHHRSYFSSETVRKLATAYEALALELVGNTDKLERLEGAFWTYFRVIQWCPFIDLSDLTRFCISKHLDSLYSRYPSYFDEQEHLEIPRWRALRLLVSSASASDIKAIMKRLDESADKNMNLLEPFALFARCIPTAPECLDRAALVLDEFKWGMRSDALKLILQWRMHEGNAWCCFFVEFKRIWELGPAIGRHLLAALIAASKNNMHFAVLSAWIESLPELKEKGIEDIASKWVTQFPDLGSSFQRLKLTKDPPPPLKLSPTSRAGRPEDLLSFKRGKQMLIEAHIEPLFCRETVDRIVRDMESRDFLDLVREILDRWPQKRQRFLAMLLKDFSQPAILPFDVGLVFTVEDLLQVPAPYLQRALMLFGIESTQIRKGRSTSGSELCDWTLPAWPFRYGTKPAYAVLPIASLDQNNRFQCICTIVAKRLVTESDNIARSCEMDELTVKGMDSKEEGRSRVHIGNPKHSYREDPMCKGEEDTISIHLDNDFLSICGEVSTEAIDSKESDAEGKTGQGSRTEMFASRFDIPYYDWLVHWYNLNPAAFPRKPKIFATIRPLLAEERDLSRK